MWRMNSILVSQLLFKLSLINRNEGDSHQIWQSECLVMNWTRIPRLFVIFFTKGLLIQKKKNLRKIYSKDSINKTLSGATAPSVLCIPQSSSITGASPSDCLVSYPEHSLKESYPSAEMQLVYSAAQADWARKSCWYT